MGLVMRFLVLCGSLFLAIQAASADPTAAAKGKVKNLPERVYHLNYVKTSDIEAVIKPLLSSKGTIETASAPAKDGTGTLVVRDDEQVLKSVDRVVTNVDVPPAQVLVEATIIEVTLNKATRESKGLDKTKEGAGSGPMNGVAGSKPAAAPPADSKLAQRFMADTKNTRSNRSASPKLSSTPWNRSARSRSSPARAFWCSRSSARKFRSATSWPTWRARQVPRAKPRK